MQSISWYLNRLRSMPAGEIWWRVGSKVRDELGRFGLDSVGRSNGKLLTVDNARHKTSSILPNYDTNGDCNVAFDDLLSYADAICSNQLSIFNLDRIDVGPSIDWNRDYASGKRAPTGYSPSIDYRDFEIAGDAKFVWEPNRHQHLVVLARAYRITGDRRYADKAISHLLHWIEETQFGRGMNWRSPLELAIRLINWVWTLDLITESGLPTDDQWKRILPVMQLHVRDIARKYSKYSSANNHLIGEAAGVFVASRFLNQIDSSDQRAADAQRILIDEIQRQTYADGGNREQALGYHMFVIEFFVLAGLAGRRTGMDFPASYWRRLEDMFAFLAAFVEGGDRPPLFGDCDDGYVVDLGEWRDRPRALLAIGAALFDRPDFARIGAGHREGAYWLLGPDAVEDVDAHSASASQTRIESRALESSGHYLLQSGAVEGDDRVSLTFDCGELGFGSLAAHGHADALSITLRAFGEDVLVDPGTYDYFTHPLWRNYFRSTRAHNTVMVDEVDQSEMTGPFLWGRRATAKCAEWRFSETGGGAVMGEHDGYRRLSDPVTHRRSVSMSPGGERIEITDHLLSSSDHRAAVIFHFADQVCVESIGDNRFRARGERSELTIEFTSEVTVGSNSGSTDPICGWVSRGYHQKNTTTTLTGCWTFRGDCEITTYISLVPISESELAGQGKQKCQVN